MTDIASFEPEFPISTYLASSTSLSSTRGTVALPTNAVKLRIKLTKPSGVVMNCSLEGSGGGVGSHGYHRTGIRHPARGGHLRGHRSDPRWNAHHDRRPPGGNAYRGLIRVLANSHGKFFLAMSISPCRSLITILPHLNRGSLAIKLACNVWRRTRTGSTGTRTGLDASGTPITINRPVGGESRQCGWLC